MIPWLETLLSVALIFLTVAVLLCLYRVIKGPTAADRIIALDNVGINLIAVTGIVCVMLRSSAFLSIILLIGILSFIGTIAFSKFLERGAIFDNDR